MTDYIFVTFQKEGMHCYPQAGYLESLADVKFLSYPHRHIFHFKVFVEIHHDDRDREFVQEKRWMESLYKDDVIDLNSKSCEMIAKDLYKELAIRYKGENRKIKIEVSEDNENGCVMEFPAT